MDKLQFLIFIFAGQPGMLSLPFSTLGWQPLIHMAQFAVLLSVVRLGPFWYIPDRTGSDRTGPAGPVRSSPKIIKLNTLRK